MTIRGLNKVSRKNVYTPGDVKRFQTDYLRVKKEPLDLSKIGTDEAGFALLFDVLAKGDGEFVDADEFVYELRLLRENWSGQKFFYEKPGKLDKRTGKLELNEYPTVTGQATGKSQITLYSARPLADVQALFGWASRNKVKTEGFEDFAPPTSAKTEASFQGHFGDRSHTIKYYRQKKGSRLISIVLTAEASARLREMRTNPEKIAATGGEGYLEGGLGLKKEKKFVSVALGSSKATWDSLKGQVDRVILHPSGAGSAGKSSAVLKGSGGEPESEKDDEPDESATPTPAELRLTAFLEALRSLPQAEELVDPRVEPHSASNQYVSSSAEGGTGKEEEKSAGTAKATTYERTKLSVQVNPGGGDCLFHALAGENLSDEAMLVVRQTVAAVRNGMPENQALNAQHVAAALTQTSEEYAAIIQGRHQVPNTVYALLQAVPGMYAGEDELLQWCILKNRRVAVIDPANPLQNGALAVYSPGGREVIPVTSLNLYNNARVWFGRTGGLVLYKTPSHWERVVSIDG